jgi:hypothetical protein
MRIKTNQVKLTFTIFLVGFYACLLSAQAPQGILATAYECHVDVRWDAVNNAFAYKVYRADGLNGVFTLLKQTNSTALTDWICDEGQSLTRQYKVTALNNSGVESIASNIVTATTAPMGDSALLDMVQRATFRYFWEFGHPVSGMALERSNGDDNLVTTGGTGFGISSMVVACERGWITRTEALNRMIQIASFLQNANRFHGVFPHWMDGTTGKVLPFSQYDNGGDLVETAFLMQGMLTARAYFKENTPLENGLRSILTSLWKEVEWDWYRKNNSPVLYWHWSPNYAWQMNFPLRGFYEAQIVYILAAASPTHSVPASLYQTGWTSSNYANFSSYYGYPIYCGPYGGGPMFFAHYSYIGFDPRNIKDAYCNYFTRNRNHALIQNKYSVLNPENHQGYSAACWGLTSSDDPLQGYAGHDIFPSNDNGTITPTAALASMPYTPAESLAALKYFYRTQGARLWGPLGFYDAFNLDQNWFANSYLAIDQGPIVAMIENYRSGLLWHYFMQNTEIQPALTAIGFKPDLIATQEAADDALMQVYPIPAVPGTTLHLKWNGTEIAQSTVTLIDLSGKTVQTLFSNRNFMAGANHDITLSPNLAPGVYWILLQGKTEQIYKKILIL